MRCSIKRDLIAVYSLYVLNSAFPVGTLVYLSRVLGPLELGRYAFAESCSRALQLVIEFGFSVTATRDIATHRQHPRRMGYIISSVLFCQLLLAASGTLVVVLLTYTVVSFESAAGLLPGAVLSAVGMSMIPYWYFQAAERLALISGAFVLSRIAALAAMLLLVRGPADNGKVLVIQGLFATACTVWGYWRIHHDVPLAKLHWRMAIERLRSGGLIFVGRLTVLLCSTLNPVIASMILDPKQVAYLAVAERISRGAAGTMHPVNQVVYPRMVQAEACSPQRAASLVLRIAIAGICYSLLLAVGLYSGAPWILRVAAGAGYEQALLPLRILALLPVCIAVSNMLGLQWMTVLRMDQALLCVTACAGLCNVVLLPVLGHWLGVSGMSLAVLLAEGTMAAGTATVLWRLKRDPIRMLGNVPQAAALAMEKQC